MKRLTAIKGSQTIENILPQFELSATDIVAVKIDDAETDITTPTIVYKDLGLGSTITIQITSSSEDVDSTVPQTQNAFDVLQEHSET